MPEIRKSLDNDLRIWNPNQVTSSLKVESAKQPFGAAAAPFELKSNKILRERLSVQIHRDENPLGDIKFKYSNKKTIKQLSSEDSESHHYEQSSDHSGEESKLTKNVTLKHIPIQRSTTQVEKEGPEELVLSGN